jgi:hypothetical protein
MNDWTSAAATLLGYAIAGAMLVLPIVAMVLVVRSERFKRRRRRFRWAGERIAPMSLRDPMDELGPLGEDPHARDRTRRRD